MTDGGLRDRFVLRADKLHPSKTLTFDQLALVETLGIGCHAVDRSGLAPGRTAWSSARGRSGCRPSSSPSSPAPRVIALDVNRQRLDFCRDVMGVDETVALSEQVLDDLRRVTDGSLPDVVIDATGSNVSMSNAFGYVAPTGRLVYVGITTQEVSFKHPVFHRPEGTLLCSRNALPRDFRRIIDLIETGKISTDPWITHRSPLRAAGGGFPEVHEGGDGVHQGGRGGVRAAAGTVRYFANRAAHSLSRYAGRG